MSTDEVDSEPQERQSLERLATLRNAIHLSFQQHVQQIKKANTFAKVALVVLGAALAGFGQFFPDAYQTAGRVIGVVGVGLAFMGGIWSYIVDESTAPDLISNAQIAIDEASKLKSQLIASQLQINLERDGFSEQCLEYEDEFEYLSQLYTTSNAVREYVENEIIKYDGDMARATQNMLDLVARQVHTLLAFHGGEHWTLSVYKADEKDGKWLLHLIAGQRADRTDEARDHRAWGPGEGAVGHCFQLERELIIRNTQDREQANWFHIPPALMRPDDANKYISFAAMPIKVSGLAKPWGVLIASSDQIGRFQTDGSGKGDIQTEPLRMLTGMIALLAANDYVVAGRSEMSGNGRGKSTRPASPISPADGTGKA